MNHTTGICHLRVKNIVLYPKQLSLQSSNHGLSLGSTILQSFICHMLWCNSLVHDLPAVVSGSPW